MKLDKKDQIEYLPNKIKHETAGGFVFFEEPQTHELFVALLCKNGRYVIPKGHLKKGEKPEAAAIREIQEELTLKEKMQTVSFLGINNYTFMLGDNKTPHSKNVHLFVFSLNKKAALEPNREEGFESAKWFSFKKAVDKISFDKENLIKAQGCFYKKSNGFSNLSN